MNEIRVLRIVNRFNLGGITYNVSYLSRYMSSDFKTLLIGGPEEQGELNSQFIPHSLGLEPVIIPEMRRSVNPFGDLLALMRIIKIIRQFKPHIVHTHASKAGALGRLAAYRCKVPVVVHTFHGHVFKGYFGNTRTSVYKAAERYLARISTAVIAISESQKTELSEVYRICTADKIHVVPLGFDLQRFRENQDEKRQAFRALYGIGENELAIGIIGRLAPIKNHLLFVSSVTKLMKIAGRRVRAVIVGDGETRKQIEDAIAKAGKTFSSDREANADFILTGWKKDVDQVLAGLDIVCLTSHNEGTPVSLIEAQAARRFIVSTEAGGVRDILHPACGLLSPPGDEPAFLHNLERAVKNLDQFRSQAGIAADEVNSRFSYRRLCTDMEMLYLKLLDASGSTY